MFRKFINIIWILMNIYLIFSWGSNIYYRFVSGEPLFECIWRAAVVIVFTVLTIVLIIRDVVPDFKKKKEKSDNGERKEV